MIDDDEKARKPRNGTGETTLRLVLPNNNSKVKLILAKTVPFALMLGGGVVCLVMGLEKGAMLLFGGAAVALPRIVGGANKKGE